MISTLIVTVLNSVFRMFQDRARPQIIITITKLKTFLLFPVSRQIQIIVSLILTSLNCRCPFAFPISCVHIVRPKNLCTSFSISMHPILDIRSGFQPQIRGFNQKDPKLCFEGGLYGKLYRFLTIYMQVSALLLRNIRRQI